MERDEVLQLMRDKAEALLGAAPEQVGEQSSFEGDLQADSLALVEYTMDLEDALGVELPEEALTGVTTVGGYLDVVMASLDTALNRDG